MPQSRNAFVINLAYICEICKVAQLLLIKMDVVRCISVIYTPITCFVMWRSITKY